MLFGAIAIILLAAFATQAVEPEPYLPIVGPPPMRFATKPVPNKTAATKPTMSSSHLATTPKQVRVSVGTNHLPATAEADLTTSNRPTARTLSTTTTAASLETRVEPKKNGAFPSQLPLPGDDLTAISPEMLVGYFKPLAIGTNRAKIYAPLKIRFTPPVPPPEHSQATYTIK